MVSPQEFWQRSSSGQHTAALSPSLHRQLRSDVSFCWRGLSQQQAGQKNNRSCCWADKFTNPTVCLFVPRLPSYLNATHTVCSPKRTWVNVSMTSISERNANHWRWAFRSFEAFSADLNLLREITFFACEYADKLLSIVCLLHVILSTWLYCFHCCVLLWIT